MTFNELWEREALRGLTSRLRGDLPAWRLRRRRRLAMAAAAAVVVAGIAILNFQFSVSSPYDTVVCNRASFPESHWAEVATHVLARAQDNI